MWHRKDKYIPNGIKILELHTSGDTIYIIANNIAYMKSIEHGTTKTIIVLLRDNCYIRVDESIDEIRKMV